LPFKRKLQRYTTKMAMAVVALQDARPRARVL
jgi:hypothetical protein